MINPFLHALFSITNEPPIDVTSVGESLAYTWFGRPNFAYNEEASKYWIGTTKDTPLGTTQHITEYNLNTDIYSTTQVGSTYQKDDHNQCQILIRSSDKRLIVFYSEHVGSVVRYRISTNPLDSSSFGTEKTIVGTSSISYVSPYQASNGDIFIFYRHTTSSSPEEWHYSRSIDGGETFIAITEFYNTGYRAYMITSQLGDKIHFLCTNGHPQTNISINVNCYHIYFDMITMKFYNSFGVELSLPIIPVNSTPINITTGNDTSWILDITFKDNLPRVLYLKYPNGRADNLFTKELWYSEFNGTSWANNVKIDTPMTGYIERDAVVNEWGYSGASRFDTKNPDIVWMPKRVSDILEIHKVDLSAFPFFIEQITFDSLKDNWRPISIPCEINNLLWLKNNYYNHYDDYSITLRAMTMLV